MKRITAIVCLLLLAAIALAQIPGPDKAPPGKAAKILYMNNWQDVIVLDESGKYLPDVQGVAVYAQRGQQPQAQFYRWQGAYKPRNTRPDKWQACEIKEATQAEFEAAVNGAAVPEPAKRDIR